MNEINKKVHLIIEMCMELNKNRVEVFGFSLSCKDIIAVYAFTNLEDKQYEFCHMFAYLYKDGANRQLDLIINKLNEYK